MAEQPPDMDASLDLPDDLPEGLPEIIRRVRARTPARLLMGRAGAAYRTRTQVELRQAHAAARDAVRTELDLERDFSARFVARWNLFEVSTQATSKDEYLLRPDLGRRFSEAARKEIAQHYPRGDDLGDSDLRTNDLQIAIGDGLSVTAVSRQAPPLLELLDEQARARDWKTGQAFVIRHCRVGILNQIGELLAPKVAILLIGERPGLATAESLSAYLSYRPRPGHSDANRNLISNIHPRGVSTADAARRIINLAARMMTIGSSGYQLREELPAPVNAALIGPASLGE